TRGLPGSLVSIWFRMASAPAYCFSSMRLLASASRSGGSPAFVAATAPALAGRTGVPPVFLWCSMYCCASLFLQAGFCHALLRIEIGGVLTDNLLIDVEGFFGLAFLEVVFPEGQIILDGAAQQAPLGVQIAQEPVHVVAGRIELQDFLVGGDGLERGALGPKGICGLNERGQRIGSFVAR